MRITTINGKVGNHMKRQTFAPKLKVAISLCAAMALAGCGGQAAPQTEANSGTAEDQQTAESASTSDAEAALSGSGIAIGDEPALTNADVAGIYLLDQETPTDVMFTIYLLKKDGTFVTRIIAADTSMERAGTYEIRDDKVFANVSAGEPFELAGKQYTAKEIKDAELVIKDGVLTANGIGSGTQTAKKITRAEYDQLVAKAAEAGPKHISVGETVSGDGYTFTVNSFEFRDEVYPSDTSGYYTYWQHEDDHDYLVADVTYTNDGTEYQGPAVATAALLTVGENKFNATIEVDGGSRTSNTYTIDPKDTGRVIVLASVPDAAREEGAEVTLTWAFPKDPKLLNYYFRNENESKMYILTL